MVEAYPPDQLAPGQKCMKCSSVENRVPRYLCNNCGVSLCIEGCTRGTRVFEWWPDVIEYIRDFGKHCIYIDLFGRKRIVCPKTDYGEFELNLR